jgi:hypothetical protein
MNTRIRRIALLAAAALVIPIAALALSTTSAYAAGPTATFAKTQDWGSGFQGEWTVGNTGPTTITGWTIEFTLPAGTSVGAYWDAVQVSASGGKYVFRNREYNGTVAVGSSVKFGFVGSGGGAPSNCRVNGGACGDGPVPSPTATSPAPEPSGPTPTPSIPPGGGSPRVGPYVDMTMERPSLTEVAQATGQKVFTLAFVLGSHAGCDPKWGGTINLDEPRIVNQIRQLQAADGDVIVAFGGAAGPYLETSCGSQSALAAAYRKVIDTLKIKHLDIDVEASIPTDMVNKALAQVQRERPGTTVSYTLMVQGDDYGLTPQLGVDVLKNAKANGVRVDIVNPMTMEFGSSRTNWGDAVIAAAESTLRQLRTEIWPEKTEADRRRMLGVTPMIGRNFNGRVFTQAHARQLVGWANANHIGLLAFWSVGRDNGGCPGGGVSPTCSSIAQSTYEFTNIFKGFRG